jgi:hypothetical protein
MPLSLEAEMSVAADIDIHSEVEVTPPQLCQEKRAALLLFWHKMSLFLPESLDFSKRTFLKSRNPASQDDSSKWTVEIKYYNNICTAQGGGGSFRIGNL